MSHSNSYYIELDRQYNGTLYDYDESLHGDITANRQRVRVKYWRDKTHCIRRFVDLTEVVYITNGMYHFNIGGIKNV